MTPLAEFFLVLLFFIADGAMVVGRALAHRFVFLPTLLAVGAGWYWSALNTAELIGYAFMVLPVIFFCIGITKEILPRMVRR